MYDPVRLGLLWCGEALERHKIFRSRCSAVCLGLLCRRPESHKAWRNTSFWVFPLLFCWSPGSHKVSQVYVLVLLGLLWWHPQSQIKKNKNHWLIVSEAWGYGGWARTSEKYRKCMFRCFGGCCGWAVDLTSIAKYMIRRFWGCCGGARNLQNIAKPFPPRFFRSCRGVLNLTKCIRIHAPLSFGLLRKRCESHQIS